MWPQILMISTQLVRKIANHKDFWIVSMPC